MGGQFDIDHISKEITKEMNMAKKWIARRTAKKMRNKLIHVYDELIDQFYSYETKRYIRHGLSSAGTGNGVNLYNALGSHAGEPPALQPTPSSIDGGIMLNSQDMSGENYNVSKDEVLDYILSQGVRYPATNKKPEMNFQVSYSDSECSAAGTPIDVLESIRDQLAFKYAEDAKEEAKIELRLKYIEIT